MTVQPSMSGLQLLRGTLRCAALCCEACRGVRRATTHPLMLLFLLSRKATWSL